MEWKKIDVFVNLDDVFEYFKSEKHISYLKSSLEEGTGRYSILGFAPDCIFRCKDNKITVQRGKKMESFVGNPLEKLCDLFDEYSYLSHPSLPIPSGAIGYIAYEFAKQLDRHPGNAKDVYNVPDVYFAFYKNLIIQDEETGEVSLIYSEQKFSTEVEDVLKKIMKQKSFSQDIQEIENQYDESKDQPKYTSNFTKQQYLEALSKIKAYLEQGDVYQVCLTQLLQTEFKGDASTLFSVLQKTNPAPFSAYLQCGDFEIVSSSPERFIQVKDGIIETCPIKGTVKRGSNDKEDEKLKNELYKSEKENAELTMIVDLERNDIGKICEFGSVHVPKHRELKAYKTVWHTVSTVRGKLKRNVDFIDIIQAVFPGGSITGTPKIRAMEIIDELEQTARGVYTGLIGFFGFDGYMDSSIVIRTIVVKDKKAYIGVGGGIVMDSDIEAEYEETLLKAKALLKALWIAGKGKF